MIREPFSDGPLSDVALDEYGRLVERLTGKVEFSNGGGIEFYADSLEAFLNSLNDMFSKPDDDKEDWMS